VWSLSGVEVLLAFGPVRPQLIFPLFPLQIVGVEVLLAFGPVRPLTDQAKSRGKG